MTKINMEIIRLKYDLKSPRGQWVNLGGCMMKWYLNLVGDGERNW